MAQDLRRMVDALNDLIMLDHDAVDAYEEAIDRIDYYAVKDRLREFQDDHRRHIRDLSALVDRLGGEPQRWPHIKGFAIRGVTAVRSMFGIENALRAMRSNEQFTTHSYREALEVPWPDDFRKVIERNFGDERRHLAYVEQTLQERPWEYPTAPHV